MDGTRMRIGLVIDIFCPYRGGAESWTFRFAQHLLKRGHQVHVVAQGVSAAGLALPVVVHRLPNGLSRWARAARAERVLRDLRLDIVHDMGLGWHADLLHSHVGSMVAHMERKRLQARWPQRAARRITHRLLPRYREFRRLTERQLAGSDNLVLAVSDMVADDYQALHGIPRSRLRVVYNGVDTDVFSPTGCDLHRRAMRDQLQLADDQLMVLFVGHNHALKGLGTAIRAVRHLAAAGHPVRLVVLGGSPPRRASGSPAAASPVQYAGRVNDPLPYYAAADVFVLPTLYDACSLSVLEAAACGLPCITTSANGASRLFTDGMQGFILQRPRDWRGLSEKLLALYPRSVRSRMGRAARMLAEGCSLEKNFDRVVEIYGEIAARRSPGHRSAAA